jgi:hypothetical protein
MLNRLPNKSSGEKTPFEALFLRPPRFNIFWVFGSKAYICVPKEKRKKLDNMAYKAIVVGHLEERKGWLFYVPVANKFFESSMARFVNSMSPFQPPLPPNPTFAKPDKPYQIPQKRSPPAKKPTVIHTPPSQVPVDTRPVLPGTPPEDRSSYRPVLARDPPTTMPLGFIANQVELGDFRQEIEFGNQELIIDAILKSCLFFGVDIPNTYKQAMKSKDVTEWKTAISEEITNLSNMEVWEPRALPTGKNVLDGRWVLLGSLPPTALRNVSRRAMWLKVSSK